MNADTLAKYRALADGVLEQITPLLAGQPPEVQGVILADLTALWLAGHHAKIREMIWNSQTKYTLQLAALYVSMQSPTEDA